MKVVCDREKLREGLAIVNNVVPSKSPKPVLENVCLVATIDGLEILGTDLDCSVRFRIPIGEAREGDTKEEKVLRGGVLRVDEPGVAVVPARVALDFVRDLSADEVTLSTNENTFTIQGGEDRCGLVTVDRDEFPRMKTCGSGLGPRCVTLCKELGLYDQMKGMALGIRGCRFVAPSGQEAILASNTEAAWIIPRDS